MGLTRSITYRQNHLVNRKTAIVVKMTLHIEIRSKWEEGEYVQYPYLVILFGRVFLWPCVRRYFQLLDIHTLQNDHLLYR